MSTHQLANDLSKASLDDKVSPTGSGTSDSPAPSNYFESAPVSGFSTPDNSRPPSPLLRALPISAGLSSRGLPSKPNVLSAANMGLTAMANNAAKKVTKPSTNTTESNPQSEDEDDDEGDATGTDKERPAPIRRTSSAAMAPFITKFDLYTPESFTIDQASGTKSPAKLEKVAIVGSGSWGTALARVAAINAAQHEGFEPEVRMWVREREVCCHSIISDPFH